MSPPNPDQAHAADRDVGEPRLAGKIALVTGAGSSAPGIGNGRASAVLMARHGARLALLDVDVESARETERMITKAGGEAHAFRCDVSASDDCESAVAAVLDRYGRIDVLMNNVGVLGPPGTAIDVDPDEWDSGMRINVTSMMLMAKHVLPAMIARRAGSIINMSSIAGLEGGYPHLLYPTSKGAIIQLTRAMAAQHGRDGIRVNCLTPGTVYTPMVAQHMDAETREARRTQSLLQTEGTAWDVAYAALYLASDESRWITGAVLPVDAGSSSGHSSFPAVQ